MAIPLLSGRDVQPADTAQAPWIALVSRSFVKRYWPGENPLGRRIDIGNNKRIVAGVVGDVKVRGLERRSEPQVYLPWQQAEGVAPFYTPKDLAVRTSGDPAVLIPSLRRIIREADRGQPVSDIHTLSEIVTADTASRRVQLMVLGAFGALAFLLAAVGIHSLLAFAVSSRRQEIGVRLALGAQRLDIVKLTVGDSLKLTAIGAAAGLALAYGVGKLLQSVLAGVQPWDPGTIGVAVALAALMAIAGSALPTVRAVQVDPTEAMRAE